jgi:hypothetical protein
VLPGYGYYSLVGIAGPVKGERVNQINNFASAILGIPLIRTVHIQDQAITTSKLADAAVITAKIANLAITTEKIAERAVTREKIAENAVDVSRLALDWRSMEKISGGYKRLVPASPGRYDEQRGGYRAIDQPTRTIYFQIREPTPDNYNIDLSHELNLYFNWASVTRLALLADGSIDYAGGLYQAGVRGIPSADIRNYAVIENKIAPGAVTTGKLADENVTWQKLAPGVKENISLGVAAYGAFPISTENISLGAVTWNRLAGGVQTAIQNAYEVPIEWDELALEVQENVLAAYEVPITSDEIQNETITIEDIHPDTRKALEGPQGPPGPRGPRGPRGFPGVSYIYDDAARAYYEIDGYIRAGDGLRGWRS